MVKQRGSGGSQMTVAEAGRRGGETTSARHGREHYEEIGRKGGEKLASKRGHEHYVEIGRKGGQRTRDLIAAGKKARGE